MEEERPADNSSMRVSETRSRKHGIWVLGCGIVIVLFVGVNFCLEDHPLNFPDPIVWSCLYLLIGLLFVWIGSRLVRRNALEDREETPHR
jgi:hypothetical protein